MSDSEIEEELTENPDPEADCSEVETLATTADAAEQNTGGGNINPQPSIVDTNNKTDLGYSEEPLAEERSDQRQNNNYFAVSYYNQEVASNNADVNSAKRVVDLQVEGQLFDDFAAEDEQYMPKTDVGADYGFEPEGSNYACCTYIERGAAAEGDETGGTGHVEHVENNGNLDSQPRTGPAEQMPLESGGACSYAAFCKNNRNKENDVVEAHDDGASASGEHIYLNPESELGENRALENEPTESDQENEQNIVSNELESHYDTPADQLDNGAVISQCSASSIVLANYCSNINELTDCVQDSNCNRFLPEDEILCAASNSNSSATLESFQPECDQNSAVSLLSQNSVCNLLATDSGARNESADQLESSSQYLNDLEECVETVNTAEKVTERNYADDNGGENIVNCNSDGVHARLERNEISVLDLSKEKGTIPKQKNLLVDKKIVANDEQKRHIKGTDAINKSMEDSSKAENDSEEELLSELDATIVGHKEKSDRNREEMNQQIYQAKQLLLERECEISRLKADITDHQLRCETLTSERDASNKEMECLKKHNSDQLYIPQIKELEYTIVQQSSVVRSLKDKLVSHDDLAKQAIASLQNEMKLRLDQVTKLYEDINKEKESMVIKFVQSEQKNLECQKVADRLESKLKEMEKESEGFLLKMKVIKDTKIKQAADLEVKNSEINNLNKELEKLKEQVSSADIRVKWAQNKLKAELEAHKETKNQFEKMSVKMKEAKEETQQIRIDCQRIVTTYQESEEVKSNTLDKELRLKECELLENQVQKNNFELAHVKTQRELEHVKSELRDASNKLCVLSEKISSVEAEKEKAVITREKYGDVIRKQKREIQELRNKVESLVQYKADFNSAQELIKNLDSDIAKLKISNKESSADLEACRHREIDRLELTSKLSRINAELQSENSNLSNKLLTVTGDLQSIRMENQEVETKLQELTDVLAKEQKLRQEETNNLNIKLADRCLAVEDISRKLEEEKDEMKTLKRKHTNNVKDLTRQLQQVRRRLENYETSTNDDKDTISLGSRTSSNGSLNNIGNSTNGSFNTMGLVEQSNLHAVQSTASGHQMGSSLHPNASPEEQEYPGITEQLEIDKQTLIDKIIKLQQMMARKNEKLEFMEDHICQLIEEIQKKNKIIQSYVLKEESGTMTSNSRDQAKVMISREHSIMGSVYSSESTDVTMTLKLSLEINRKLQAVLEDTLLKNMTLKESLDTLGQEIARLSQENHSIQMQLHAKSEVAMPRDN